ncbi:MAG TPA: carboxypeptidase regulatory-like domain-containing protein [Vicinamibacterales bacterium]|nr:carboxypeptidase regulatory-like domain-containing protein [Vicinamibacterales bacterium]
MLALAAIVALTLLQQPATIGGDVVDPSGLPLPGVVVTIKGTTALAVTDEHGHFSIVARASDAVVQLELSGFTTRSVAIAQISGPLHIVMSLAPVSSEIVVRAPAAAAAPDPRMTLRPLDIVRTAGTQADVMRALSVLPGVAQVDEGAGIFVRGGDVSETTVLVDEAPLNHPYRYETPTGGFRGAVDPFLTQGVSFTTGGFSAAYGNSLSGVVDMRSLDRPAIRRITATAGLAGVSLAAAEPLGSAGGVRVAVNRATPAVLFAVNPSPRAFDQLPGGWDASASAYYTSPAHGTFKVFMLDQHDHVGVQLEQDAFDGFLHSTTGYRALVASWRQTLASGWTVDAIGSADRYVSGVDVGVAAIDYSDDARSARFDLAGSAGSWSVRFGADAGATGTDAAGVVPERGGDFAGVSGTSAFDVNHHDNRAGGYVETSHAFGIVTPTVGVRSDYFSAAHTARVDPRVNVIVDLGAMGRLRGAWGIYHQAPSPEYFDQVRGATTLAPMTAVHYIAGYETGKSEGAAFFRAEAYYKTYRDLPVQDDVEGYADTGYGDARGLDLYGRRVWHYIDLRASASFVHTERRWTSPNQQDRYPLPPGTWTPDFSIPYTWQVVLNAPVWPTVWLGMDWREAAGRPMTPAIGSTATPDGYEPIWGPINSERLPRYKRVDLSVSYLMRVGSRTSAVLFASVDNLTNHFNFFEYAYSADYSSRHPVASAAPRGIYVGCTITR